MIRMMLANGPRRTLLLGLSRANTERLLTGQPIVVDLQALSQQAGHPPQDIVIIAGETEDELLAQLRAAMPAAFRQAEREGRFRDVR